ncbi:MAG: malto-oligosyltrehalose trehalohydrolase [Nitrospira sp.]|nr:malto-oligosyltrehalose trehalohydrolase [Nitrospira sp.]MDH4304365.1 malto-oligosyltrehalose trehalohydrolase [Nitrospira sp.]MDH5193397.1 malto-oligosyltrehalose trehalohydrolase [Nitrospira sp.]
MNTKARTVWSLNLGATPLVENAMRFRVWAPHATEVAVQLLGEGRSAVPLQPEAHGYFEAIIPQVAPLTRYRYVLDGSKERPDPASRFQPEGVHGPSAVVDPNAFQWMDQSWNGLPLKDFIIYELHVGTFTNEGTFEAVIPHLRYLKETVGITAIELMPVAQFPGRRNWGYDGASPFAVQSSYGGPDGLKRLVNACHKIGLAVILDVVYNHLGPEGNYLGDFGPYFTDHYQTPWGLAINYDGPESDAVRQYVIGNALYWVTEYHIDALRLDAIHGIFDFSAHHILKELTLAVHQQAGCLGRQIFVIAESDLNDVRIINLPTSGGYGLDGQWNDDFHHALRVSLTGERAGYYEDFRGLKDLGTALREGFVYSGQHSAYRRRRHGNSPEHCRPSQFVVFSQNHDQIGNRAVGDRLSTQLPLEALKVARATVLLSPNIPLLFMGEEYGERAPFQYFIEHGDPDLVEAVRQGRRREFAHFGWKPEEIPDPQDPATLERCRLDRTDLDDRQTGLLRWTHALIQLRKAVPVLAAGDAETLHHSVWVFEKEELLVMHRWSTTGDQALLLLGFKKTPVVCPLTAPVGVWQRRLSSGAEEFGGSGADDLPPRLAIQAQGTPVTVPGYSATVYVLSEDRSLE